ncbi:MAG: hypothetical protein KBS76_03805 [Ruminococcus sp.]|nr:hypothetical protein [Candidatus Apopatosoma intestinale]
MSAKKIFKEEILRISRFYYIAFSLVAFPLAVHTYCLRGKSATLRIFISTKGALCAAKKCRPKNGKTF